MSEGKRKALETIFAKLEKLLPHLGNANPHEAAVALGKINVLLASVKLDWHDLVTLLVEQGPSLLDTFLKMMQSDDTLLINLGLADGNFFHTSNNATYCDIRVDGHRHTLAVAGPEFAEWLTYRYFTEKKKAPKPGSLKSAIRTLAAHAVYRGERHEVHLRAVHVDGKIYIDIGDTEWRIVEIDATGWRLIEDAPVRFRRTAGMTSLPIPERGGSIEQLRPLVNLDDRSFILFVSWIIDALCPASRPHPVLYLAGEEGSAKSTAAKIARGLIDPNAVPLRSLLTTVRELFVSANGSYSLAFDNISTISAAISDALCMIATGTGFGTRQLYTDTAQILIGGSRSVILNGLLNAIDRSDLADRAVIIAMSPISQVERFSEAEVWKRFEAHRAQIFGALLDCVASGLNNLPSVELQRQPRMADFALWSVATEAFAPGVFINAFEHAAAEATKSVAEQNPVSVAIGAFMIGRASWVGTAAELLHELSNHDRTEAAPSTWKGWPTDPSSFGKRLRSAAAVQRKMGISVEIGKASDRARTRTITLAKTGATERPNHPADTSDASDGSDISRSVTKVA